MEGFAIFGGAGRGFATLGSGGADGTGMGAILAAGFGIFGTGIFGAAGVGGATMRGFGGAIAATFGVAILGVATLGGANFGATSFGGGAMMRFAMAVALGDGTGFAGRLTTGFAGRGGAGARDIILGGINFDWGGFAIDGVEGGFCVGARALTTGRLASSGGNVTFDFGGSLGGVSSLPRCGARVAVAGPVVSGVKGRSIFGKVRSGPNLSKTVRSTITLGRLDPGE
jgi:hypothetical protein